MVMGNACRDSACNRSLGVDYDPEKAVLTPAGEHEGEQILVRHLTVIVDLKTPATTETPAQSPPNDNPPTCHQQPAGGSTYCI
jgi:hypothetical protein